MAKYICGCTEHEEEKTNVGIKFIDGRARHDIKCPCGQYMELADPKTGMPSFKRNRLGQVL
jgi:hypothetical protein